MRIAIIGAGYVGLVTGIGFAHLGHDVTLVDIDAKRVGMINQAKPPIYEHGLEPLLKRCVGRNLVSTIEIEEAVRGASVVFICVQTPSSDDGSIDLSYVRQSAVDVGAAMRRECSYCAVVVKSTVIPGTTEKVVIPLLEQNSGRKAAVDFGVVMSPEFLREGNALEDFFKPDRTVLGELDQMSGDVVTGLYRDFDAPLLRVHMEAAEMIKYASNAFLATKISFINEVGNICKGLGVDVNEVAKGMGLDSRISPHFLSAGIGFGGSCFPKDVRALTGVAKELGYKPYLLESVMKVNEEQPLKLVTLAESRFKGLSGKKAAVLGLTFKAGTDDMREAPSITVIRQLLKKGVEVNAYDPVANGSVKMVFGDAITCAADAAEAISETDMVFVLTEWDEFRNTDLYQGKPVFDGRGVVQSKEAKILDYEGVCW